MPSQHILSCLLSADAIGLWRVCSTHCVLLLVIPSIASRALSGIQIPSSKSNISGELISVRIVLRPKDCSERKRLIRQFNSNLKTPIMISKSIKPGIPVKHKTCSNWRFCRVANWPTQDLDIGRPRSGHFFGCSKSAKRNVNLTNQIFK